MKKSPFKLSIEVPVLLVFVNLSQIFFRECSLWKNDNYPMNFLLVKSIVTVVQFFIKKRVKDFTNFFKINNVLVKNFALLN